MAIKSVTFFLHPLLSFSEKRRNWEKAKKLQQWGEVLSKKIARNELKPGDHIYSWRLGGLYAHHGIYVGEGKVIHYTTGAGGQGSGFISSSSPLHHSRTDGVVSSCLECFLSGGERYLFLYGVSPIVYFAAARGGTCTLAHSDPHEVVLHRAKSLLDNGFGDYNIFTGSEGLSGQAPEYFEAGR